MAKTVTLIGVTRHGKNRVHEQGAVWKVLGTSETVLFSPEPGPWLLLESLDGKHCRWVSQGKDRNFLVEEPSPPSS